MNISKLRTEFLKTRTEESKKCLNFCVSQRISVLACSVKLRDIFFGKLHHRFVSDNRNFGKNCWSSFLGEDFSQKIFYFG